MFTRYNEVVQEIQQKAIFKRVLVHRKAEVLSSQLERKEAQLAEVLKTGNVEASVVEGVEKKLDEMISGKNKTIEETQQLLASVTQTHENVVRAYEVYLNQNGVPGLVPV